MMGSRESHPLGEREISYVRKGDAEPISGQRRVDHPYAYRSRICAGRRREESMVIWTGDIGRVLPDGAVYCYAEVLAMMKRVWREMALAA
jgi:hypothetical protein